jgi:hypothetical protein
MGRTGSTNGEKMSAERILVGKPEGKRPLRIPRYRWEGNIVTCVSHVTIDGGLD